MKMMLHRRSVNPSELVTGLAEGRDVCVRGTDDADIQRPHHDLHFTTHARTGEPCHLHRSTVDIRHFT